MTSHSPQVTSARASVWRIPGMTALAATTFAAFCGYAMLLPIAPLWAVYGGATTAGAGLVNGVLLAATVATQLLVPRALHRLGWAAVLTTGMVLLGLPAMAYAVSDRLAVVLALSAVRGVGFGIMTVTGSAAVARLGPPGRRGEAIGAYGLAIALPNLVLLPLGPWVADHAGFWVTFLISGAPVLGIPAALRLAAAVRTTGPVHPEGDAGAATVETRSTAYARLARPMVLLLAVTLAGGSIITFAPQMVSRPWLTTTGLFVMGLVTALVRWRAGLLADRHGAGRFLWPLVILTVVGMACTAWSVTDPRHTRTALFLVAMVIVGVGYGALQNLTLVMSFNAVSAAHHNLASAVWNVGFDAGTGLGSVVVGAVALHWSFTAALVVTALTSLATLPLALRRRAPHPHTP